MKKNKPENDPYPAWCSLNCPHAELPREAAIDGSGSCRTFSALYCTELKRYVFKNSPCAARKKSGR